MSNLGKPRKYDIYDEHEFESWESERRWIRGYLGEEIHSNFPDITGIIYFSIGWIAISVYLLFIKVKKVI